MDEIRDELRRLTEKVELLRQDIAETYLSRSDFKRRRRQFFLTLGIVAAMLVAGGWLTQRMTLDREHQIVRECFLRPSTLAPSAVHECTVTFGREYAAVQAQSANAGKVFADLQQRVKKLEDAQRKR